MKSLNSSIETRSRSPSVTSTVKSWRPTREKYPDNFRHASWIRRYCSRHVRIDLPPQIRGELSAAGSSPFNMQSLNFCDHLSRPMYAPSMDALGSVAADMERDTFWGPYMQVPFLSVQCQKLARPLSFFRRRFSTTGVSGTRSRCGLQTGADGMILLREI